MPASEVAGTLFKCEDGTRIFPLSVCDGIPDCPDWSDELKCTGNVVLIAYSLLSGQFAFEP